MWTRVSLWVMAPGRADRLDGRDGWTFVIEDAHEQAFSWKGIDYSAGRAAIAPAYLDVELPPGTYVTWATRASETTHRAVLAVHDEQNVIVRLLPTTVTGGEGHGGSDCAITVDHVKGTDVHDRFPATLVVTGTAVGCAEVDVDVSRQGVTSHEHGSATVASDGTWTCSLPNALKVRCGDTVTVTVTCAKDRSCSTTRALAIDCE